MKIRADFVTNSSSSCYVTITIETKDGNTYIGEFDGDQIGLNYHCISDYELDKEKIKDISVAQNGKELLNAINKLYDNLFSDYEGLEMLFSENQDKVESLGRDQINRVIVSEQVIPDEGVLKLNTSANGDEIQAKTEAERRKAEAEAQRRRASEAKANELTKNAREMCRKLEEEWSRNADEYNERVEDEEYSSYSAAYTDMRQRIRERDRFGKKYDELIADIDARGKKLLEGGCSAKAVAVIRDTISEIIDGTSDVLDLEFSINGEEEEDEELKFSVSDSSKSILHWWSSKYEDMPEIRAEKQRRQLNNELREQEAGLVNIKKERSGLDNRKSALKLEISRMEETFADPEKRFEGSKAMIEEQADSALKTVQEKINALRSKKTNAERAIRDMETEILGLSFFKRGRKKEIHFVPHPRFLLCQCF